MKRIIALLIVTVLCLGMLASCEVIDQVKDMIGLGQPESGATVADAISFLDDIYKTKKETTLSDFDVVAQVKIDGVVFPVTWTSDNEKVSIRESTKTGFYTVDLPDQNTEEFSYKLTATIAVDGVSESRTYSFKMPAVDNGGITSEPIEGVAYKLFLLQGGFNQRFYALATTQNNENKFINTTLEPKEGVDFFVEKVDGGYKWYTMVGDVKTYVYAKVERTEDANTGAIKYSKYIGYNTEEGSVFSYNANKGGVWTVDVEGLTWGVGTYGTYTTICISEDSYFTPEKVGSSQYVVQFMTSEYANTLAPDELPEAEDDAKAILDQLYALADGETASGNFKLTGKITALDSHNNPTIVVEGYEDKPVYCYYLADDRFVVDAVITVSALQMKNYGGTYEFMSCTLEDIKLPGGDASEMTIPEVLAAAEGTEVKVTGTVESFYYAWDDNYGNCSVYIVDEAGNKLLAFRLATKVAIGDNITVTGTVAVYNGVNQIAQGCTAVINSSGDNTNPETPALGIVTEPEVGKAYKFGLYHGNESATVYFNGQNYNNYAWYLAYSATGVDVYLEAVEGVDGGYRLYFMNGDTKTYIRVYQDSRAGHENDGTIELVTSTPAEYFTFSTEYNTLLWTNANGAQSYLGSSGTYKSISCSNISYITNDNTYIAHLYAEGAEGGEGGEGGTDTPVVPHEHVFVEGKCECGAEDPNYVPPVTDGNEIVFDFGANGTAGTHADGQDIGTSKTYTSGNYSLVITDALKAFDGGFDKAGNSILKFGTSSVAGTITFVVPDDVVSVVIYAARYKSYADNNIIVVNGTEYTLTTNSDDGQYEAITVDTTTNKTVTVASSTSATKPRCVVNSIVWILGEGSDTPVVPHEHNYVDGKCECGAEDPNYVPPHEHVFVEGKCECGEEDPNYVAPEAPVEGEWQVTTELKTGDQVIIGAPAYGKLLSSLKYNNGYYNAGVDYSADNFANVTDAEIWTVTVNDDGTYTFTDSTGKKLGMAASYSSFNSDGPHFSWALEAKEDNTFFVKNTGRNLYIEWYDSSNNWSGYGNTSNADLFKLSFYIKSASTETPVDPHEHTFVEGKCECGAEDPNYVPPTVDPETPSTSSSESLEIFANTGVLADDNNSISWTGTNFTLVNDKATSTSPIRVSDADHFRVYKYNVTTISGTNGSKISKIEITCTNETQVGYLLGTTMSDGVTATSEGLVVTLTVETPVDSIEITASNSQWRLNYITVYFA